ncbi:LysM domain-containing protein [Porcincola intestinalis]|uniref:LysM domain-containing protein n=1 Tax=Porcincola intestinalis TaxID=2606632 RepID=UPI002A92045D|nr:LysM domain-containing protein [Porcincola intestinalis]MDY5579952.1 LysM domain-containing protein [Porcincola intestinalis]
MSTKAEIWLNANNDSDAFQIPVNPESIKMTYKGITKSIKLDSFGEILHKGKREAATISFSSFFPAVYGSFCAYKDFPTPLQCNKKMIDRMESKLPVHFVYCDNKKVKNVDIYAYITSYVPEEKGGDPGTIQYSVELKEARTVPLKVIVNGRVNVETTRLGNFSEVTTYTIKKKDTLYKIAKSYYKKNVKKQKKKLIAKNKSTLASWNKKYKKAKGKNKKKYIRDGAYRLLIGGSLTMP